MKFHPYSKLWLRDTDHMYSPIRLESENVPKEDLSMIESLCPKRGSILSRSKLYNNQNTVFEDYNIGFCDYCLSQIQGYGKVELQILNKGTFLNQYNALNHKLRVLTKRNQLLYLSLDRIRMNENGDLYIVHDKDKSDKAKYAGIYLHFRDKNGNRIYEGDIIRFE